MVHRHPQRPQPGGLAVASQDDVGSGPSREDLETAGAGTDVEELRQGEQAAIVASASINPEDKAETLCVTEDAWRENVCNDGRGERESGYARGKNDHHEGRETQLEPQTPNCILEVQAE
jgi:hypothetical protein